MKLEEFIHTLQDQSPPSVLPPLLQALWYDSKGQWDKAHQIADGFGTSDGDWVHAYLHRVEGDTWNANYWYRRAGKSIPNLSLEAERTTIIKALLEKEF